MIVIEKTRDIGVLKALGASNGGVMKIFLAYGLLLGTVGALCGTGLGLTITTYINEIEHFITWTTGQENFSRDTYYFNEIPTNIQPLSVLLVNVGAVGIAVLFSVLPALRAAMLHPVRALRYEKRRIQGEITHARHGPAAQRRRRPQGVPQGQDG